MTVGFSVFDHLDRGGFEVGELYENRLRLAEAYDEYGFHAYFVAEHHGTTLGAAPCPGIFLSALAQRTQRLRFGPMVYVVPTHEPLRLIEEICMLDQLSGGRFEMGMGRGNSPYELALFGMTHLEGRKRFQEATEIILSGLASPMLNYEGRYYEYIDVPMVMKPVQQPHPPLWYGLARPTGAPWPAQHRCNVVMNGPLPYVKKLIEAYLAEWKKAHGDEAGPPMMGTTRHIYIAETTEAAETVGRQAYENWYKSNAELWHAYQSDPLYFPSTYDEAVKLGVAVVGTPDAVRDKLAHMLAETGLNHLIGRFAFGDIPLDKLMSSLSLFATEIMPALAEQQAVAATA